MVAEEKDRPRAPRPIIAQSFNHLRRMRTAIDEIAKEHDERLANWTLLQIMLDPPQQTLKQVESTVDVANRISAMVAWSATDGVGAAHETENTHF
ncbi:hypothetical protein GCM10022276_06530 [Sphingomonas limnosediminicola]|uniref:Uncharacterized protein n=1 Tax=Sphingomonas limnosediminicola TaxID=940133 RepID=A0ABP7KX16_9SPHN